MKLTLESIEKNTLGGHTRLGPAGGAGKSHRVPAQGAHRLESPGPRGAEKPGQQGLERLHGVAAVSGFAVGGGPDPPEKRPGPGGSAAPGRGPALGRLEKPLLDQAGGSGRISVAPKEFKALCEGFLLAAYEFRKYKTEKKNGKNGQEVEITLLCTSAQCSRACAALLEEAVTVCRQINACRDLVNEPGSSLDPVAFAEHARKVAKDHGLTVRIRDEKKLVARRIRRPLDRGQGIGPPSPHGDPHL